MWKIRWNSALYAIAWSGILCCGPKFLEVESQSLSGSWQEGLLWPNKSDSNVGFSHLVKGPSGYTAQQNVIFLTCQIQVCLSPTCRGNANHQSLKGVYSDATRQCIRHRQCIQEVRKYASIFNGFWNICWCVHQSGVVIQKCNKVSMVYWSWFVHTQAQRLHTWNTDIGNHALQLAWNIH